MGTKSHIHDKHAKDNAESTRENEIDAFASFGQVRLKIADDNDLNTAKEALGTMAGFFASITEEASRRGGTTTAFGILQVCGMNHTKRRDCGVEGRWGVGGLYRRIRSPDPEACMIAQVI